jgi:hypothetical protein
MSRNRRLQPAYIAGMKGVTLPIREKCRGFPQDNKSEVLPARS